MPSVVKPAVDELVVWAAVWCAIGVFSTAGVFAIADFAGALCRS